MPEVKPAPQEIGISFGKSRIGFVEITRNSQGFITQIKITQGKTTRTITITRDAQNRIVSISETIT